MTTIKIILEGEDKYTPVSTKVKREMSALERAAQRQQQGMAGTNRAVSALTGKLGGLGVGIAATAAAYISIKGLQMANEFAQQGQAVTQTANTFQQLSGSAFEANASLEALRKASRGGADDMTLQAAANQFLRLEVAKTNEEAARLVEITTNLKRPVDSLTTAFDNMGALLANQSILRLDSLGISSGRVTARIEELRKANENLSKEDAFLIAFREGAEIAEKRLGPALEGTVTRTQKVQVAFTNLSNKMAASFNVVLQEAVGLMGEFLDRAGVLGELDRFFTDLGRVPAIHARVQRTGETFSEAQAFIAAAEPELAKYDERASKLVQTFEGFQASELIMANVNDELERGRFVVAELGVDAEKSFINVIKQLGDLEFRAEMTFRKLGGLQIGESTTRLPFGSRQDALASLRARQTEANLPNELAKVKGLVFDIEGPAERVAGSFRSAAEEVAIMRQEIESMSLDDLLGVRSGGAGIEAIELVKDAILADIGGLTPEAQFKRGNIADAFLLSGQRATGMLPRASEEFQQQAVLLGRQVGNREISINDATDLVMRAVNALQLGRERGISGDETSTLIQRVFGGASMEQAFAGLSDNQEAIIKKRLAEVNRVSDAGVEAVTTISDSAVAGADEFFTTTTEGFQQLGDALGSSTSFSGPGGDFIQRFASGVEGTFFDLNRKQQNLIRDFAPQFLPAIDEVRDAGIKMVGDVSVIAEERIGNSVRTIEDLWADVAANIEKRQANAVVNVALRFDSTDSAEAREFLKRLVFDGLGDLPGSDRINLRSEGEF